MFSGKIIKIKNTLLFRLTILYAGLFSLSALLIFLFCYFKIYTVTMHDLDTELLNEVQMYSSVLREEGLEDMKAGIAREGEKEDPEEVFYRVLTMKGEVLITTNLSSWGNVDISNGLAELQGGEMDHVFHTLTGPGTDKKARMITAMIAPLLVLQIGETLEDAETYLLIFRNWFLVLLIFFVVLSSILGWFMAKRALLDMEDVTKTAFEISQGAYDRRVQVKDRFEEIRMLGGTFNTMLDRIQNLLKSLREVNANIAHDLRSPLTRIRGIAEMSLMNMKSADEYKVMAASTIEECDRLIEIVNTMLEITEIESGISKPRIEELDVVTLIRDACEIFHPTMLEKHIALSEDMPDKLTVKGDRKKLQRIISNLLDNAIKYTFAGGSVTVSAYVEEDRINIVVKDSGIGISEAELPHIFDRFYRCDRSRSRDGVGLGLSLVKAYTEAMKGTVSVLSAVNGGSRFSVTLPL
ncbi:MAG: HAMP domain-containing protein [Nitrospiraceae bacterium]|nr:MAG: HAMP domain-containing protein [Nitrospiraceae bacterium]